MMSITSKRYYKSGNEKRIYPPVTQSVTRFCLGLRFVKGLSQQAKFEANVCSMFCSEFEYNLKFPISRPYVPHIRKRTKLECKLPSILAVFCQWSDCDCEEVERIRCDHI